MIPITMKKDMVTLLGRAARWEGVDSWDSLSFEEKLEFASLNIQNAITMLENLEVSTWGYYKRESNERYS